MGNINQKDITSPLPSELKLHLKMLPYQKQNPNYGGKFKILNFKNDPLIYAIKIEDFINENDYYTYLYSLNNRKEGVIKCDNFISVIQVYIKTKNLLCGSSFRVYSKYEYIDKTLRTYIDELKTLNFDKKLTKTQLFYVVYTVIETLMHLEKFNIFHGNINPDTILITNDGLIKLTDPNFLLQESSYHSYLFGKYKKFYLCPSTFKHLKLLSLNPRINPEKSNVFCLGLTLLEAMLLCDINSIYDMNRNLLLKTKLEEYLKKVIHIYDKDLCHLLIKMLNLKKSERFGYQEILNYLKNSNFIPKRFEIENLMNNKEKGKGDYKSSVLYRTKTTNLETTYQSKGTRASELKSENLYSSFMFKSE